MPPSLPRLLSLALFAALPVASRATTVDPAPLRVLIAGMAHGHIGRFLHGADPRVVTIVGVEEPDTTIWRRYARNPRLRGVPHYSDLAPAIAGTNPEAVWAFSDTLDHLSIVQAAAPRHLSVIVEKPLAVSWAAASEIAALAHDNGTLVLTNYETSWYPAFADIRAMLGPAGPLGPIRQIYVQAGHEGPVKIHVGPEFLDWLRDPVRAGGGALFDFGCYGINLVTWWLGNRAPEWVSAQTADYDPTDYPHCDDHAVVQLGYPDLQATVVGSWHWPYPRKDAAVSGERGAVVTSDETNYTLRLGRGPAASRHATSAPRSPLAWFAATIRAGRDPVDDPSSLANNLIVMRVLDAARRSAAEHRAIRIDAR
ncbi:MAG TPA: Gfo/Idh/MocA family oxidoreductase [Opitutaceae bacterium]|nr:Gfo/Idh/MocA family oxidoreductase [Opitutaceae bacterium]